MEVRRGDREGPASRIIPNMRQGPGGLLYTQRHESRLGWGSEYAAGLSLLQMERASTHTH